MPRLAWSIPFLSAGKEKLHSLQAGAHKGKRKHQFCSSIVLNSTGLLGLARVTVTYSGEVGSEMSKETAWLKTGVKMEMEGGDSQKTEHVHAPSFEEEMTIDS